MGIGRRQLARTIPGAHPALRLAVWAVWALVVCSIGPSIALGVTNLDANLPSEREDFLLLTFLLALMAAVYATVGALVSTRRPRNAVGWLLLGVGLCLAVLGLAYGYGDYALYGDGRGEGLPLVRLSAWTTSWLFILPVFIAPCFLMLLFPDGSPPSPRWRPVVAFGALTAAVAMLSAVEPGPLDSFPTVANPLGASGPFGEMVIGVGTVGEAVLAPAMFVLSVSALIVRFRRSRGRERAQLKWLTYAGAVMVAAFALLFLIEAIVPLWVSDLLFITGFASFGLIPVAAGIAILRHRLYDIDVVINRTLVYAALTATLAGAYVASVLVLQLALSPLTEDSGLAIAGSTLAVAALFRPARARIQAAVDRRFYRRKYDAEQTLEAFAQRLRDQVELDAIAGELRRAVGRTVEPAGVAVWLNASEDIER